MNVRGCKEKSQQETLCSDAAKYVLQILGITETLVREERIETIKHEKEGTIRNYKIFHAGIEEENAFSGVGILVEESLLVTWNAKTGSGHYEYPENIGKYGKGKLNNNGEFLLDLARENKLILTNTLFPHRLAHRTTWTSNERIKDHKHADGTNRRNPYRNQIDYIITKKTHRQFIQNSRSYSGIETYTDHKLVKAEMRLEWWRLKRQREKTLMINIYQ